VLVLQQRSAINEQQSASKIQHLSPQALDSGPQPGWNPGNLSIPRPGFRGACPERSRRASSRLLCSGSD